MKKGFVAAIVIILTSILLFGTVSANEYGYVETNGVKLYNISSTNVEGYVNVIGETNKSKLMIMLERNGQQYWYDVKLENGRFNEQIWLNKGTGQYTVNIMVNEYERKYSFGPKLTVENTKELNPLLSPDKHIESADKAILDKAAEVTKDMKSDLEKAKAIYLWAAQNIKYDYEKYAKHLNNDYDNQYGALLTLKTGKGVCYDYATLIAAMGRASGIQTKVVTGTGIIRGSKGYHAWNEMYLPDENRWVKMDATFASVTGDDFFDTKNFDESHIIQ